MKPVEFPGHNIVYGKDQPEYMPLPALRLPDGEVITCWELSDEELQQIITSKKIYLKQLTFNQPLQPVLILSDLSDGVALIPET